MDPSEDSPAQAAAWIDAYRAAAPGADVLAGSDDPAWPAMLEELAAVASHLDYVKGALVDQLKADENEDFAKRRYEHEAGR